MTASSVLQPLPESAKNRSLSLPLNRSLLPEIAGWIGLGMGILVAIGWHLDWRTAIQISASLPPMKYNSALGFILAGAGLLFLARGRADWASRLGGAVASLGLATLGEYVTGHDFGIDQFFVHDSIVTATQYPGRMSPLAAGSFLLLGSALAAAGAGNQRPSRGWLTAIGLLACIVAMISGMALLGYACGIDLASGWGAYTRLAVHTASTFCILDAGLLLWAKAEADAIRFDFLRWLPAAGSLTLLGMIGSISASNLTKLQTSLSWHRHSYEVLVSAQIFLADIFDVQRGMRGYVFTGWQGAVDLNQAGLDASEKELARLETATRDSPVQQENLKNIRADFVRVIAYSRKLIDVRKTRGLRAAVQIEATGEGFALINQLVAHIHVFTDLEQKLLEDRSRISQADFDDTTRLLVFSSGLAAALIVLASLLTGREMGRRNRTEASLRESEERVRLIVDSIQDYALLMLEPGGNVASWNGGAERLHGYPADEIVGKHFSVFYPPEAVFEGCPEKELRNAAREGRHAGEEWRVRKDGSRFLAEVLLTPIRADGGRLRGFVQLTRDITERKRRERQLQDAKERAESADRAKSEFLANMSHEIRTPMNGVIGMTNLLLDSGLDAERHALASTIRASAESLLGLINDILDFSKIEAGQLSFEEMDFDLRKGVEDALESMAGQAQAKGLELVGGVDPRMNAKLRGDPGRVHQILINLIGNAIKFTPSGEIAVQALAAEETAADVLVRFEVRDTGIGIPPEVQHQLFRPFVQGDGSTSRKFGGTGLGLAICKRLAQSMHGEIGVRSTPGAGSLFWVTLRFPRQTEEKTEPPDLPPLPNVRVLVVDDNATGRQLLQRQIGAWRMRGDCAGGGEEALAMLHRAAGEKDPYRLAIVDAQMPEMDGAALAAAIGADARLNATRLLLLTAFGRPVADGEPPPSRIAARCVKPVRQSALFDCIVQVLSQGESPGGAPPAPTFGQGPVSAPSRRERVLLVEDNSINQQVALGSLRKFGYNADVAANGLEALRAIESQPYDLILMDCQMPELDGYETTREIRRREKNGHRAWIVAMTANVMTGDREKCLAAGMDDYIGKPLHRAELRAALERGASQSTHPAASAPPGRLPHPLDDKIVRSLREDGELFATLIGLLERSGPEGVAEMRKALEAADGGKLALAAHTLKGSSGNMGATTLRELCDRLEEAGLAGDLEKAAALFASLDEELNRFIAALKAVKCP